MNPTLATNLANYLLVYPAGSLTGAKLLADQTTVSLGVSPAMTSTFGLRIVAAQDTAGNGLTNKMISGGVLGLTAADIGAPGVDPADAGTAASCDWRVVSAAGGGSGIGANADHFLFVYTRLGTNPVLNVEVSGLEPVDRFTQAGLMIREDLTPGARFCAILANPGPVPATDGSGICANEVQALYRATPGGPVAEWNGRAHTNGVPQPGAVLSLMMTGNGVTASLAATGGNAYWQLTLGSDFGPSPYAGLAVSSHNNQMGNRATANFTNVLIYDLRGDEPTLTILSAGAQVKLIWGSAYTGLVLQTSTTVDPWAIWMQVTPPPTLITNRYGSWYEVALPVVPGGHFFRLIPNRSDRN